MAVMSSSESTRQVYSAGMAERSSPQGRSTFERELCTGCLVCTIKEAQQPGVWPVPSICPRELLCSCLTKMVPRYLSQAHFLCLYLSPRSSPLKIEVPLARSGISPCIFGKFTPAADPHKRLTTDFPSDMTWAGCLYSAPACSLAVLYLS